MNKKLIYSIFILVSIIFTFSYTFAANDNSMMHNAAESVKNVVGGAENAVEDAARGVSDTSKNITGGLQNAGNNVSNTVSNTMNNVTTPDNSTNHTTENQTANNTDNSDNMIGTNNNDNTNYTAARTATTSGEDTTTFLGMNSTVWIWIIMGIAALGIGILVYSYFNQTNRYEHSDE